MTPCNVSERELSRWYDGLPGSHEDIAAHAERCESCAGKVAAWRADGERMRAVVDRALGDVEPLLGLQAIRQRIASNDSSLAKRLRAWWQDLWTFNRRAVAGVVAAAAVGALTAPAVAYWMGGRAVQAQHDTHVASVVVEEFEYAGSAKAVVYQPESGKTTIIWVEPDVSAQQ
jgi:anti-sigma factor RsiW